MDRERELDEKLPIIPHEWLGAGCCGCLMIRLHGDQAEILCNECGASIRTVAVGDVGSAMAELAQTDEICTAICTHRVAVNSFPGFSAIEAFICSECAEGVAVARQVQ